MKRLTLLAAGLAVAAATTASAQSPFDMPVKARQGAMAIIAVNLGILGDMARGNTEYDAEAAQTAANSLAGVSMVDFPGLFVEGSDMANYDGTKAIAAIWEDMDGFAAEWAKVQTAAPALAEVAGNGAAEMGAALGAIGSTCRACHSSYRGR